MTPWTAETRPLNAIRLFEVMHKHDVLYVVM